MFSTRFSSITKLIWIWVDKSINKTWGFGQLSSRMGRPFDSCNRTIQYLWQYFPGDRLIYRRIDSSGPLIRQIWFPWLLYLEYIRITLRQPRHWKTTWRKKSDGFWDKCWTELWTISTFVLLLSSRHVVSGLSMLWFIEQGVAKTLSFQSNLDRKIV